MKSKEPIAVSFSNSLLFFLITYLSLFKFQYFLSYTLLTDVVLLQDYTSTQLQKQNLWSILQEEEHFASM